MPTVQANGLSIEYESLGDPTAPPIVLIMGLGMQLVAWPDDFCRLLVERGFRVVRFDNRDCGLSSRVAGPVRTGLFRAFVLSGLGLPVRAPYSLEDMAADTVGLMEALGIARAHVVGASMGGMIAQVLAARFPGRVLSLTSIMSSSGHPRHSRPEWRAARALLSRPANPRDADAVVEHLAGVFGVIGSPGYRTDPAELRRHIARGVRRAYDPAGTVRQLLAVIRSGDRRASLRAITAPTLVVHGADDPLVPVAAGRDTARHIPGARLMVIEGMGHDLPAPLLPALAHAVALHCAGASSGTPRI